jgi:hypothetical protein
MYKIEFNDYIVEATHLNDHRSKFNIYTKRKFWFKKFLWMETFKRNEFATVTDGAIKAIRKYESRKIKFIKRR